MELEIIHCISSIDVSYGGPARSMPSICIALKKVGIKCKVITKESPNPNSQKLIENDIPITFKKNGSFFSSINFLENVKSLNGVVHIQNIWDPSLHKVAEVCKRNNIPYLISPRGMLEPWALQQKKLKKKIALWLYQSSDMQNATCIHATAESEMRHIRDLGIMTPIAVIPNGIDVSSYPLKDYTFKQEKKRLLFLSRIHPKKGIDILLEAWNLIPSDLKADWELVIAGEGDSSYSIDDLNNLIKERYSSLKVSVVGPQYGRDKISCYHSANIFVLPTYSENFGMVIAEAMCCGVPVITTKGTPWKELEEKRMGWYIDLSVDNLKSAIESAIGKSNSELEDMGRRSRDHILENYSIDAVASKYKDLYRWIKGEIEKPKFVL